MEDDQINQCKYWSICDYAIWFANNHWRIGDLKAKGSEACLIKAQGSSDLLPTELEGQWLYWNPDSKDWMKAGHDLMVKFAKDLPYNKDSIE